MTKIDFFKQQAKNFFKDYKSRIYNEKEGWYDYSPRFFIDLEEILEYFEIKDNDTFTLMNAQHIIAKLSGFYKWNELIKASEPELELGMLLLQNRLSYHSKYTLFPEEASSILDDWKFFEEMYLKDASAENKLEIFKKALLNNNDSKIKNDHLFELNFEKDINSQDMIKTIVRKKGISIEKSITSSITQKNFIDIIDLGYTGVALSMWNHANPEKVKEKLQNPIVKFKFTENKQRLVAIIMEKENITFYEAIMYFVLIELKSLGYHI